MSKAVNNDALRSERDEFLENNLLLVHSLAKRYTGRGVEYDDLYSAGCVGLIKAYNGFDKSKGYSFSTYAVPVILGEIKRLFRDGGALKVSRSIKELSVKLNAERARFEAEHKREPTVSELALRLGVSAEQAAEAIDSALPPASLTIYDDGEQRTADIPVYGAEEQVVNNIALNQAISSLCETDRAIIALRYFGDLTQSRTAEKLNMTQVAVSRREKRILQYLRTQLNID